MEKQKGVDIAVLMVEPFSKHSSAWRIT